MCGCVKRGGEREISFSKATQERVSERDKEKMREREKKDRKKKRKAECSGVTILFLIALAVSVVQNMTLSSLSHDRNTGDWINTILCSD